MKKPTVPTWKRSLLSCAVSLAVGGLTQQALAVDLCDGNVSTTISTATPGSSCVLDAGDSLTVTSRGALDEGVDANDLGHQINNAGSIGDTRTAIYYDSDLDGTLTNSGSIVGATTSDTYAVGVYVDGGMSGSISNSGLIKGRAEYEGNNAYASGIYINGDVDGTISNSGTIAAEVVSGTATGSLYGYGLYMGGSLNANLTNSGLIESNIRNFYSQSNGYGYGIYLSGNLDARISNTGTLRATGSGPGNQNASVLYVSGDLLSGASIVNSGTIEADFFLPDNGVYSSGIYVSGDMQDSSQITNAASGRMDFSAEADDNISFTGIYST